MMAIALVINDNDLVSAD